MNLWIVILPAILGGAAALFAFLAFIRTGDRKAGNEVTAAQVSELLRNESDWIRQAADEHARASCSCLTSEETRRFGAGGGS